MKGEEDEKRERKENNSDQIGNGHLRVGNVVFDGKVSEVIHDVIGDLGM